MSYQPTPEDAAYVAAELSARLGTTVTVTIGAMPTPDTIDPDSLGIADVVAVGRAEDDYCQCGTQGCCIDHRPGTNLACATW